MVITREEAAARLAAAATPDAGPWRVRVREGVNRRSSKVARSSGDLSDAAEIERHVRDVWPGLVEDEPVWLDVIAKGATNAAAVVRVDPVASHQPAADVAQPHGPVVVQADPAVVTVLARALVEGRIASDARADALADALRETTGQVLELAVELSAVHTAVDVAGRIQPGSGSPSAGVVRAVGKFAEAFGLGDVFAEVVQDGLGDVDDTPVGGREPNEAPGNHQRQPFDRDEGDVIASE